VGISISEQTIFKHTEHHPRAELRMSGKLHEKEINIIWFKPLLFWVLTAAKL
jgi:hypothetical protein